MRERGQRRTQDQQESVGREKTGGPAPRPACVTGCDGGPGNRAYHGHLRGKIRSRGALGCRMACAERRHDLLKARRPLCYRMVYRDFGVTRGSWYTRSKVTATFLRSPPRRRDVSVDKVRDGEGMQAFVPRARVRLGLTAIVMSCVRSQFGELRPRDRHAAMRSWSQAESRIADPLRSGRHPLARRGGQEGD